MTFERYFEKWVEKKFDKPFSYWIVTQTIYPYHTAVFEAHIDYERDMEIVQGVYDLKFFKRLKNTSKSYDVTIVKAIEIKDGVSATIKGLRSDLEELDKICRNEKTN